MERRRNARRRLFAADTNGSTTAQFIETLQREHDRQLQAKKERWNFDFQRDQPLEGEWEWIPVSEVEPTEDQMTP